MADTPSFLHVIADVWRVASVLKMTPVDELIDVTKHLAARAPADGWMAGAITPRRLERDTAMLTALRDFQLQLKAIDAAAEGP